VLYHFSHSISPFLGWVFFELGSHELFAWAGFIRGSLPDLCLLITGISHQYPALFPHLNFEKPTPAYGLAVERKQEAVLSAKAHTQ
jgi:hypothetical protein